MTNEHESIRSIVALAAAGALGPEDSRGVDEHVRGCAECRRQLESWGSYASGLRRLPQPQVPMGLVERTQRRILQERAEAVERRRNDLMLGALAAFSLVFSFATWALVRFLVGGSLEVLGMNLVDAGPWFIVSSLVAGATSSAAAITLADRREARRMS